MPPPPHQNPKGFTHGVLPQRIRNRMGWVISVRQGEVDGGTTARTPINHAEAFQGGGEGTRILDDRRTLQRRPEYVNLLRGNRPVDACALGHGAVVQPNESRVSRAAWTKT